MQSDQFAIFKKHSLAQSKSIAYMGSIFAYVWSFGISVYMLMHVMSYSI